MRPIKHNRSSTILSLAITVSIYLVPMAAAEEQSQPASVVTVRCDEKDETFNAIYQAAQSDETKRQPALYPDIGEEAERLYTKGLICFREGNYDRALPLFKAAMNKATDTNQ